MASRVTIRVRDAFLGRGLWTGTRVVTGTYSDRIVYKWFSPDKRLRARDLIMSLTDTYRYIERQEWIHVPGCPDHVLLPEGV